MVLPLREHRFLKLVELVDTTIVHTDNHTRKDYLHTEGVTLCKKE